MGSTPNHRLPIWLNPTIAPDEKDPMAGPNDGGDQSTVTQRPIRRRLNDVPQFVFNRGGECFFIPSLSACAGTKLDT